MSSDYIPYGPGPELDIYNETVSILKPAGKPINLQNLLAKLREKVPGIKPDSLYYRVLLQSSKDPNSPISSSKGINGGYFYQEEITLQQPDNSTSILAESKSEKKKYDQIERRLWAPVARWLLTHKRPTLVSSKIADSKKGGIWGNPDVVGLAPLDRMGFFDVEITSIEVKPTLSRWQYFFFEAVAHQRFAEKSYFAFYEENEEKHKIDDLKLYAEKYGVGLLHLDITAEHFGQLAEWDKLDGTTRDNIVSGFVEIMPAPYSHVELALKCDFLENLGIRYKEQIYKFGQGEDF